MAILLISGILLLHPPRLNAVVDPKTAIAIGNFALNTAGRLFPSGVDPTDTAILRNRELIKNLNREIDDLKTAVKLVLKKLDKSHKGLREDMKKIIDSWKEDRIRAMVALLVEDDLIGEKRVIPLKDRLAELQKASRDLFQSHDRNAYAMIIAMRYELPTLSDLDATQEEIMVRAKAYHDRFQKILNLRESNLLPYLYIFFVRDEYYLKVAESSRITLSSVFDAWRQQCDSSERTKICGVEWVITNAERRQAIETGSKIIFTPMYELSEFGKQAYKNLRKAPCELRDYQSSLGKMQADYFLIRYYHSILKIVEMADRVLVDRVLEGDERAFRYETISTQRLDVYAKNLESTKARIERDIKQMEHYNDNLPAWRTENGFHEVSPSWRSRDGGKRMLIDDTCPPKAVGYFDE